MSHLNDGPLGPVPEKRESEHITAKRGDEPLEIIDLKVPEHRRVWQQGFDFTIPAEDFDLIEGYAYYQLAHDPNWIQGLEAQITIRARNDAYYLPFEYGSIVEKCPYRLPPGIALRVWEGKPVVDVPILGKNPDHHDYKVRILPWDIESARREGASIKKYTDEEALELPMPDEDDVSMGAWNVRLAKYDAKVREHNQTELRYLPGICWLRGVMLAIKDRLAIEEQVKVQKKLQAEADRIRIEAMHPFDRPLADRDDT